jgi:hypothetical protein
VLNAARPREARKEVSRTLASYPARSIRPDAWVSIIGCAMLVSAEELLGSRHFRKRHKSVILRVCIKYDHRQQQSAFLALPGAVQRIHAVVREWVR